jgi:hypothetical protein
MKTNKHLMIVIILLLPGLASCQNKSKMSFSVGVVDDENKPIIGCDAKSIVFQKHVSGEGFGRNKYDIARVKTNEEGIAHFSVDAISNRLAYGVETPNGYYKTYEDEYHFKGSKLGVWQPKNEKFEIVLKRIKNPIAMYAKKGPESVPARNIDIGYDLIIGDWLAPHGHGKSADLVFHMKATEVSRKEFSAVWTIKFPNEKDGLIAFEHPIQGHGSHFKSNYMAPDTGYIQSLTHTWVRKPGIADINTRKRTMNYYVRIRTKLDDQGNVVSAHYGKIYGDLMKFTHYLNPTLNDRNVEFDPKKNLIDTGRRGHKVQKP